METEMILEESRQTELCQKCKREAILVKNWEGELICKDCMEDVEI